MRRILPLTAALFLLTATAALAAGDLELTVTGETATTITFSWTPPAGAQGYKFFVNNKQVSNSQSGTVSTVRFGKASCDGQFDCYVVSAQTETARGGWKRKPACSNGRDDDNDGKVDYPADPGCTSATDNDETDPAPPPPPPGPATMTPTQFRTACAAGPVANVEVTGTVTLPANCHATNVTFDSYFGLADGVVITGCAALAFDGTTGASNWTLDSCVFDGRGQVANNPIYDSGGKVPKNWHIVNSTFQNYYSQNTSTHSEALYVGYSDGGEIRGNHFINNGTTSDIFFTWWADNPNPATTYARNICVSGNTFRNDPGYPDHYYAINFRAEIPTSSGIKTDPNEQGFSTTSPQFNGTC